MREIQTYEDKKQCRDHSFHNRISGRDFTTK
jgi:hypothetical protein